MTTIPTIGFNCETVDKSGVRWTFFDLGGQDKIRPLWRHYYQNTGALIFVVDSTDRARMEEAKKELIETVLSEEELKNMPLLIWANKQDLASAMSKTEIIDALALQTIGDRQWHVELCEACSGGGLSEGLDWLASVVIEQQKK